MRTVFADTFYWIALANPRDDWHDKAINASKLLFETCIVTTEEALTEFLNFFSGFGERIRQAVVIMVRGIQINPNIEVLPQTPVTFKNGLEFYEKRKDKDYSLTDCIYMNAMRDKNLTEVLTHDHNFAQEGFTILLQ